MPCADAEIDNVATRTTKTVAGNHSGHDAEKHNDACSPFCICNCCGVQVLNFTAPLAFNIPDAAVNVTSKLEILYKSHMASMFSGSIWQPPQIA
ncbi:hypothetical protein HYN49_02140 [Flavobacterium pallidum]|uniref:Uncharacterized protein n=2 Tax=Flavobacterium pallidum TaxID=2172098 RepID=A0A2S1SEJ2_9FLAO|nr:hypothetical protein HYN49_02140 [Flavobacterium pallidum]